MICFYASRHTSSFHLSKCSFLSIPAWFNINISKCVAFFSQHGYSKKKELFLASSRAENYFYKCFSNISEDTRFFWNVFIFILANSELCNTSLNFAVVWFSCIKENDNTLGLLKPVCCSWDRIMLLAWLALHCSYKLYFVKTCPPTSSPFQAHVIWRRLIDFMCVFVSNFFSCRSWAQNQHTQISEFGWQVTHLQISLCLYCRMEWKWPMKHRKVYELISFDHTLWIRFLTPSSLAAAKNLLVMAKSCYLSPVKQFEWPLVIMDVCAE